MIYFWSFLLFAFMAHLKTQTTSDYFSNLSLHGWHVSGCLFLSYLRLWQVSRGKMKDSFEHFFTRDEFSKHTN